jgi:hypothetical protein
MKILIATTEFSPLTAPSPTGDAAALIERELLRSKDVEAAVALPAFPDILIEHRDHIRDINVRLPIPASTNHPASNARILEAHLDDAPQIFLIDAEPFHLTQSAPHHHDSLILHAWTFAQTLIAMLDRLEPPPHLVHCFGWQSALTFSLLPQNNSPCRTAFTPETEFTWSSDSPSLAQTREAASRLDLPELTNLVSDHIESSLAELCLAQADQVIPINENLSPQAPLESLHHLSPRPIIFAPAADTSPVLNFADRLLIDGASLALQNSDPLPPHAAAFETLKLTYPGQVALLPSSSAQNHTLPADPDILLILPAEAAHPETPGRILEAVGQGRIAVVPHASIPPQNGKTFFYRGDQPESIWCALKRALTQYRQSAPATASQDSVPGDSTPPLPSPGTFLYRSLDTYSHLILKTLTGAAA